MRELKMFTDSFDYFVATNLDDVRQLVDEHHGGNTDWNPDEWKEVEPDSAFRFVYHDDCDPLERGDIPEGGEVWQSWGGSGYPSVEASVRAWIAHQGRGFFATTEY